MALSSEVGTASREEDDGNIPSQALRLLIAICVIAFGCAATNAFAPYRDPNDSAPLRVPPSIERGFVLVVRM